MDPSHIKSEPDFDDDPVISSVPVVLSTKVQDHLAVLQYPTRQAGTAGSLPLGQLRLKPKSQVIEQDISTELPEAYLDEERATKWGDDGQQTFGGILQPAKGRYAIGELRDGELHLQLVGHTSQLRPQFTHYNRQSAEPTLRIRQEPKNTAAKPIQMSAKTMGEHAVQFSEVLEFWKEANDEEFEIYAVDS